MTKAELTAKINAAEHELNVREIAAGHLRGIPARQNAAAISTLYDKLCALNIARIEA